MAPVVPWWGYLPVRIALIVFIFAVALVVLLAIIKAVFGSNSEE